MMAKLTNIVLDKQNFTCVPNKYVILKIFYENQLLIYSYQQEVVERTPVFIIGEFNLLQSVIFKLKSHHQNHLV